MAQATITRFYTSRKRGKNCEDLKLVKNLSDETKTIDLNLKKERNAPVCQSPKRNLNIAEESSPSKRKPNLAVRDAAKETKKRPGHRKLELNKPCSEPKLDLKVCSPNAKSQLASTRKIDSLNTKSHLTSPIKVCSSNAKSQLASPRKVSSPITKSLLASPRKVSSPLTKSPLASPRKILSESERLEALINQSRTKLLSGFNKEELKRALASFSEKTSKLKDLQSNAYKITAVATSSANKTEKTSPIKSSPKKPAYERFKYLAESPSTSLLLPVKYKVLFEMFQSLDTVVSILNNRKEKVTFEKVKEGVQKMMKRNFGKQHLGQIIAVYPSAYTLELKKSSRKLDGPAYELIISPNLSEDDDGNSVANPNTFVQMQPQSLLDRKKEFHHNILNVVKKHHQEYLVRIKFPSVSGDKIKFWHPQFPLDSVPDIQPAEIPEPPESKIYSAKDVLNAVKGSLKSKNKVEKALQIVAEKSTAEEKKKEIILTKPENSKTALQGVCTDLIEKIRARESAKLLETMTRDPGEVKRKAMLERLPRIINILWHYFVAERKAAVPVDVAVEKIIHSLNTLSAPDDVKEHLKLITETFPGWLTFVKIPKGTYITIDKKRNINDMLANFAC